MLRSCQYCGRIHDASIDCPAKAEAMQRRDMYNGTTRKQKETKADKFRYSRKWRAIREEILHRDRYLCLCCLAELEGTDTKYNTSNLSVHHVIPINKNYELRADVHNLITVCDRHHDMCERGLIDRDKQRELIFKSEKGQL